MKLFKTFTNFSRTKMVDSMNSQTSTAIPIKKNPQKYLLKFVEMDRLDNNITRIVEKRTRELNELIIRKNKFLSILAHDLRSPFSSIIASLDLMKMNLELFNKNDFENYVNIAQNSSNNALKLLDNLLGWAAMQNADNGFKPAKINLQKLFLDEIEHLYDSARQKQLTINHSIADNIEVIADRQMLKTILRNLISNAIKFSNPNELIIVNALYNHEFVEISVKDHGIGISSKAQENLFKIESFCSTEGTNHEKGTGLGLLLCKEFVEKHAGKIYVESSLEHGSTFKFTLPI